MNRNFTTRFLSVVVLVKYRKFGAFSGLSWADLSPRPHNEFRLGIFQVFVVCNVQQLYTNLDRF